MNREMVSLTIDDRDVTVPHGTTVLKAAAIAEIAIPTLCHHKEVTADWGCRLCIVEVFRPGWRDGEYKIDAACTFPVEEGLVVRTDSERVVEQRKIILQLLLSKAPESEQIRNIALFYDVSDTPYLSADRGESSCILCGLCIRVCNELIGADAIGAAFRGVRKEVTSPFNIASTLCIGCLACVRVCPTGTLQFQLIGGRIIKEDWGVNIAMVNCRICGKPVGSEKQIKRLEGKVPVDEEILTLCPKCRRKKSTETLKKKNP